MSKQPRSTRSGGGTPAQAAPTDDAEAARVTESAQVTDGDAEATEDPATADTTAVQVGDGAEPAEPGDERTRRRVPLWPLVALVALAWLAVMLRSAQVSVSTANEGALAVYLAAYSLPGLISASLTAGAATALAAVTTLGRVRRAGATVRFAVATVVGLLVGLGAAVVVLQSYGRGDAITILAGTFAASATVGGAFAGIRHSARAGAVVNAALGVFLVGFLLNLFQGPILDLYGAGDTQASQANALSWFSLTASIVSGLVAGVLAYLTLRSGETGRPSWFVYLGGGAGAGAVLLVAEAIARTGGRQLLDLAGQLSEVDRAAQDIMASARVNNGLVVFFVGAITAMILLGRTLKPREDEGED